MILIVRWHLAEELIYVPLAAYASYHGASRGAIAPTGSTNRSRAFLSDSFIFIFVAYHNWHGYTYRVG